MEEQVEEKNSSCAAEMPVRKKRRPAARKSGKKLKSFRETMGDLLKCYVEDEGQSRMLEEMGLEPTYLNLINLSSVRKAAGGDTTAARFIRDTVEEKGRETVKPPAARPSPVYRAVLPGWPSGLTPVPEV